MSDLEKIEQMLQQSTSPRQKAMAESLLKKFKEQQQTFKDQKTSEIDAPSSNPTESQPQTEDKENDPSNNPLFKAVGVIQGEVELGEDGNNTINIKGKVYRLKYAYEKRRTFEALKLELKNTGKKVQRLIVYPRAIHFPSKEQPHQIYFELVGFQGASVQDKGRAYQ